MLPRKTNGESLITFRNDRAEVLEHVQVRVERLAIVEIEAVLAPPPERLPGHFLQAGQIDPPALKHLHLVVAEIVTDHGDHPHIGKERCRHAEVRGRAPHDTRGFAEGSLHTIECGRSRRSEWDA